ncbi:1747cffc-6ba8-4591-baeb-70805c785919 [Thermothielavioides terrestris]|uniref:Vegetative cell wall protein gp1 n=2 Tax=Thermothielavioides terrestris TaxID=2587410 RepID=G2QT56_THETT|nr:uncharacterized protein THITE_2110489 [Thermothielavioides terrestris NRRL 8126]AEO64382.1 hypothetical protein THITE_2110489 [Thermothielavioides terrestris NRRL 8126]SPQ26775.1 1747cffc-6ba8-4591-baeb-70805c785919 [Thermothielavioides terrestris]
MATYSPYGSTPGQEYFYDDKSFPSPSPTPSPRGPCYYYGATPQRPATRAHFRNGSTSGINNGFASPRPPSFSPRYTSDGQYATVNVSVSRSSRKPSFSGPPRPTRERRSSFSYHRATVSHGESDEDEFIDLGGHTFVLPGRSRSKRYKDHFTVNAGGHGTDYDYYAQGGPYFDREAGFASPRYEPDRRPPPAGAAAGAGHSRRNSTSVPQRPQTARPAAMHRKPPPPPPPRQATEADARRHKIPPGFSLKNWDPTEEPILLLGSVFDANSLGKWIYDWTIYHHGAGSPIGDMSGELWLLLIQLAGKIKRAEETVPKLRSKENREILEEFIEAGYRLTDKLRKLIKLCEAPMLRSASKRKEGQLGKNAGVEFVETLWGRDREFDKTDRFMASVRLWNLRFDTNCEEMLRNPSI